ncbi:MAG: YidC/Oxa1 family membrane protein insertase [Candidatus Paceibacterota bacterium]|jgi:YidC/Oxa1 family membrane protein insertase
MYSTFFYEPLYNGLVIFINIVPWHNVGLAVVLFTILIKIILFPLSQKSVKTQFEMKLIEPELNEIKLKYKDNKQLQAEKTMLLYKERGINPFSGIFLMIIQLPVLIALYQIFLRGGLPNIDLNLIYSFIGVPDLINMNLFGINIADKSILFAFFAAISQFLQMQITLPKAKKIDNKDSKTSDFKDELAKSMNMQMKYVMPIVIFFIAKSFPVVVSLYLITSSLFAIGQELYIKKTRALITSNNPKLS